MTLSAPVGRRYLLSCLILLGSALGVGHLVLAKLETWREETASAFMKGRRERVVVSESGRVRLGQDLRAVGKLDATHVWDLVRTPQGVVYAATGDAGKVFRHEGNDNAPWSLAYDAADTQALSLAVLPDGHVVVGTGPSGQVIDVTDPKHPATRPGPTAQYIWDLATDPKGNLYAATGPTGQLWKRSPDGKWTLLLDSKHPHLLCVATGPDGAVYAGSDGEGLIYRVGSDGKTSVLFDAPQTEVRALLFGPDGALYAGTAAESGGGGSGGSGRGSLLFSGVEPPNRGRTLAARRSSTDDDEPEEPAAKDDPKKPEPPGHSESPAKSETKPRSSSGPSGGSASPRPISPGDNAVYRVDAEGVPREVFRIKALIYALAWQGDRLLVGTGPEGQFYEVRDLGRDSTPFGRLDNGQILALLADSEGILVGAGDPGSVVRLLPGYAAVGTLLSTVHDTKIVSRFGALTWRADVPKGTSIAFQVRSGNVGEPDATWSAWSPEQTDPDSSRANAPPGRFVQYRVTLKSTEQNATPEVHSVALLSQSANLPPEITKIDVPDVSASDGSSRQSRMTLRWDVTDPNGDDLIYTLHIRKDGWPDWIRLGEGPQTESSFAWDSTAVPAGTYRLRVTASDRPSNNPTEAQSRDRESEPFIVDHRPPTVTITPKAARVTVVLKDNLTRLVKASYALDGGDWLSIFPDDGLFDTPSETITIALPDLKPGTHILVVRATDAAGNLGTGDAIVEIR